MRRPFIIRKLCAMGIKFVKRGLLPDRFCELMVKFAFMISVNAPMINLNH